MTPPSLALLAALAPALVCAAQPATEHRAELSSAGAALVYRVAPTDLTVAQRVRVELSVTAPAGWSVSWPAVGEKLGRATVVDTTDTRDGAAQTRTYTLEPFLPGEDTIPPLSVSVSPRDPQAGAAPVTLTTEPVTLSIRALLAESDADAPVEPQLRDVRDDAGASEGMPGWMIGALAALVPGALGIAYVLATRRRAAPADPASAALARIDAIAAGPAPGSSPQRNAALDDLASAARAFLQSRGVSDAVGAATPDLATRLSSHPVFNAAPARLTELLSAIDAARFDPRSQGVAPPTLAAELGAVLRPALAPPPQPPAGGAA